VFKIFTLTKNFLLIKSFKLQIVHFFDENFPTNKSYNFPTAHNFDGRRHTVRLAERYRFHSVFGVEDIRKGLLYLLAITRAFGLVNVTARDCPAGMEWTECMLTYGTTCDSLSPSSYTESRRCIPGCQCSGETVFDQYAGSDGSCVEPSECRCRHMGTAYPSQSIITMDFSE